LKKLIILFLISTNLIFASYSKDDIWAKGESFLTFLEKHQINKEIYFNLSKEDKELCSEIYAGVGYQILYDNEDKVSQVLIPISEEMQIHIFKDLENNYAVDIIPIEFDEIEQTINIPLKYSPYQDIIDATNNKSLANEFMLAFKNSVNFRGLRAGANITIKYKQKIRLGEFFGTTEIIGASVSNRGRDTYIFQNPDDKNYYDIRGKSLTSVLLKTPLRYTRISSKFTKKRWHPILKKYRAHLGVDFAAPTGRRIYATADGKVIYRGRKGGYGKTVIIRHKNGLKSLYAHLNSYSSRIRVGSNVKQGTFIARVGSTGRSTGPHLHFGIYKNGRAINPLKLVTVTKTKLTGKKKKEFLKFANGVKRELMVTTTSDQAPFKLEKFESVFKLERRL
jgi:murein DD-endopeptidase MepM/ murein hydrolase activator NlpD